MNARPARVHIDAMTHDQVFPCTLPVPPDRWNGWECPTFDRATAERVIAMVADDDNPDAQVFLWTTDRDGVDCLLMGSVDGFEIWWEYVGNDRDGYTIGAYSWTWSEIPDSAPADDAGLDDWLAAADAWSARYTRIWNKALHEAYARGAAPGEAAAAAQAAVNADDQLLSR